MKPPWELNLNHLCIPSTDPGRSRSSTCIYDCMWMNTKQANHHILNIYFTLCLPEFKERDENKKEKTSTNNKQEKYLIRIRAIQRIRLEEDNGEWLSVDISSFDQGVSFDPGVCRTVPHTLPREQLQLWRMSPAHIEEKVSSKTVQ